MSSRANTKLLEEAKFHMDFWTDTIWEKLIQQKIDDNDLESLQFLLAESQLAMHDLEYTLEPEDVVKPTKKTIILSNKDIF